MTDNAPVSSSSTRVLAIDILRGFTILTMVFVNDLAGVHGMPWWMRHAEDVEGLTNVMTFVDMVFSFFLFIVGMAIPFALENRFKKGDSSIKALGHVLLRTIGLLTIGIYMVNLEHFNTDATGISRSVWSFLMFFSVLLVWNQYPTWQSWKKYLPWVIRIVGIGILIYLGTIYRGNDAGHIVWMKTRWWGILGLIGWAYLVGCISYLIFRKNIYAHIGVMGLLILLYGADKAGVQLYLAPIPDYIWIAGQIGGHGLIVMAGLILALLFTTESPLQDSSKRIRWVFVYAFFLAAAGYLQQPLHGISKNNATPTWGLYSAAAACLVYILFYWISDVKKITKWSKVLSPAGSNPLLAYILPSLFYSSLSILGIKFLSTHFKSGVPGFCRSVIFAFGILGLTALLSKCKIKLRL